MGEILTAIIAALQFPKEINRLIAMLKKTPQQKHEDILRNMEAEAKKFEETGRPTWD